MKKMVVLILFSFCLSSHLVAQQSRVYLEPDSKFLLAKEYFQKEMYSLSYPLFLELNASLQHATQSNEQLKSEEILFYTLVCQLKLSQPIAEKEAQSFYKNIANLSLKEKMAFHLAEYYFKSEEFRNALEYYDLSNIANLSNVEISSMKFKQGYCHFYLGNLEKAKTFFLTIKSIPNDPNYQAANYFYGYIVFGEKKYNEALDAFKKAENHPEYGKAIPYYIANIYYKQGKKDEAIRYAETILSKNVTSSYDTELRRLIGHAYFEKKQFAKARPLLEYYIDHTDQPGRDDLYQLSYCYYDNKTFDKAINGFKKLSEGSDSLSQSAMYLLGDAYLKTGQKANARNAFAFSAYNSSNNLQREVSQFNYGKLSFELGYQDVALSVLRSFLDYFPSSEYSREAKELLVNMLAGTNNFREALGLIEGMGNLTPDAKKIYAKVLYGRAMELVADQDLAGAENLMNKILPLQSSSNIIPAAHFWKGEIAFKQERWDDAIRSMNNYVSSPTYSSGEVSLVNARYTLGYAYMKKENFTTALSQFEFLVKSIGPNANDVLRDAYVRSADCLFMKKDFGRAKVIYGNILNYGWPFSDYASYQLALIAGVSDPSDKIRILQGFEKKFPSSDLIVDVNMEIASAYLAGEMYKDAIPYLLKLINNSEASSSVKAKSYLKLGIAYYNLDNNKEALRYYQQLIKEYPNAAEIDEALESARSIYVEESRTNDYVQLAASAGRNVTYGEQDSLSFSSAENKFLNDDLNGANIAFDNYLKQFPDGQYQLDAIYYKGQIYLRKKEFTSAIDQFAKIADRYPNKFAQNAALQAARLS
ncbi:MAG: tetratricopeptide repeat protein, partial [Chitinophagaceae bacterium]